MTARAIRIGHVSTRGGARADVEIAGMGDHRETVKVVVTGTSGNGASICLSAPSCRAFIGVLKQALTLLEARIASEPADEPNAVQTPTRRRREGEHRPGVPRGRVSP